MKKGNKDEKRYFLFMFWAVQKDRRRKSMVSALGPVRALAGELRCVPGQDALL